MNIQVSLKLLIVSIVLFLSFKYHDSAPDYWRSIEEGDECPSRRYFRKFFRKVCEYSRLEGRGCESHSTYYVSRNIRLSWRDSLDCCRRHGMDLATFETKEEQDTILESLPSDCVDDYGEFIFIGGTMENTSYWRWASNNKPINYEIDWAPVEPNNRGGSECCMDLVNYKAQCGRYLINDDPCDWKCGYFLCEDTYTEDFRALLSHY